MNPIVSKKWVMMSFLGSSLLIVADEAYVRQRMPRPGRFFMLAIAFVALGFLAEAAPDLAGSLALLVLIAFIIDSQAIRKFGGGGDGQAGRRRRVAFQEAVATGEVTIGEVR